MRIAVGRRRALFLCAGVWLTPTLVRAQSAEPSVVAVADSGHRPSLFTRADPLILGAFVLGAAAIGPFDKRIANEIREPEAQNSKTASNAAKTFNWIGSPGVLIASVASYGVGRIGHFERVADLGLHTTEAIVVSAGVTYLIKGLAGRQRPSRAGIGDPDDFKFGGGFGSGGGTSFPSGHATAAFATATVVTLETHRWWPKSTWYVAPVMFGGATLVGVARLYTNAHWASDVVMGAGIGTLTALKVVRYNHVTSPNNRVNRWLLTAVPTVSPNLTDGGVTLGWSFDAPR
ncbi:MAG: phosphoesterase PA-phosphatase related protein [Gemmatimonadetes bacterium]|nr:phosphoesterase PA-phosphatase related protein [Gemmatimonadota bacterium]